MIPILHVTDERKDSFKSLDALKDWDHLFSVILGGSNGRAPAETQKNLLTVLQWSAVSHAFQRALGLSEKACTMSRRGQQGHRQVAACQQDGVSPLPLTFWENITHEFLLICIYLFFSLYFAVKINNNYTWHVCSQQCGVSPTSSVRVVCPTAEVVLQQLMCSGGTGSSHQSYCGLMKKHLQKRIKCWNKITCATTLSVHINLNKKQVFIYLM